MIKVKTARDSSLLDTYKNHFLHLNGDIPVEKQYFDADFLKFLQTKHYRRKIKFQSGKYFQDRQKSLERIKIALDDEKIAEVLRNKEVSRCIREQVLVHLLRDSFNAMVLEFPMLYQVLASNLLRTINNVRIDDQYKVCNSSYKFGANNNYNASCFVTAMFHEMMHNYLFGIGFPTASKEIDGSYNKDLEKASIHEFICELVIFAMFSRLAREDRTLFNKSVDRHVKSFKYEGRSSEMILGTGSEEHDVALVTLMNIINECRENSIDLSKLFPEMLIESINVLKKHLSSFNQYEPNITFKDFVQQVLDKLNEQGKLGVSLLIKPERIKAVLRIVRSQFSSVFNGAVRVPRIQVV